MKKILVLFLLIFALSVLSPTVAHSAVTLDDWSYDVSNLILSPVSEGVVTSAFTNEEIVVAWKGRKRWKKRYKKARKRQRRNAAAAFVGGAIVGGIVADSRARERRRDRSYRDYYDNHRYYDRGRYYDYYPY